MASMQRHFRGVPIQLGDSSAVPLAEVSNIVQVLRAGEFSHPEYGDFKVSTEDLAAMVRNFDERVRGTDIAIDFAHESEHEAAGWIQKLYLKENGTELWAEVKWTPTGQKALVDREYRYLSADFAFAYRHNETKSEYGPTLFGAGLTNRPFVKNMAAVVELNEGKGNMQMDDKKIQDMEKELADLKKEKESRDVEFAEMKKKLSEYEASNKKSEEEKLAAETKVAEMKRTEGFNKLLTEGRACEAQRESYMSGDMDAYAAAYVPVNLDEKGHGKGADKSVKTDAQDEVLELANKLVASEKIGLDRAISRVLSERKDLNEKYIGETSVAVKA